MTSRRTIVSLALLPLLASCGGKAAKPVRPPVPFGERDRCRMCGMVIANYGGPKAQVFLKGVDEAVKFCSVRDAFSFMLQPENERRLEAAYVCDMSKTEWGKPLDAPLVDAKKAFYVYGSDKKGAMGLSLVPFSGEEAARAFREEHGGRILAFSDVTLAMLASDAKL